MYIGKIPNTKNVNNVMAHSIVAHIFLVQSVPFIFSKIFPHDVLCCTFPTLIKNLYVLNELFPFKTGKEVPFHEMFPESVQNFNVVTTCEFYFCYKIIF